ncbi:hypothetical protein APHAL10511_008730 [Amanita phalloides]|nr:hypothetical protein APHAL10511_008730 [Amanita phalloides]
MASLPRLINACSPPPSPISHTDHSVSHLPRETSPRPDPSPPPSPSLYMSARVDAYPMPSQHRRDSYDISHRRPSPPPIATLNPSPSPSIIQDRSAMSTPPARRTPPQPLPSVIHTNSYYSHEPVMLQSSRHHPVPHFQSRPDGLSHSYAFSAHPPFDHRYEHTDGSNHSSYHNSVPLPSHAPIPPVSHIPNNHVRDSYTHSYPLTGQAPVASIYTDDANTKLSDRVRRRCFNCCTTDTSTWRRSNLSPGKVLCNKCGLFERTHSRPRPEQFPHKRGPLTGTALSRSRTPPTNQLPPISPPYNYSHPSIAPLNNVQDHRRDYPMNPLPGLQTWHPHPTDSGAGPGQGPVTHVAPISLPPPSQHHASQQQQHHPQHNGHGHGHGHGGHSGHSSHNHTHGHGHGHHQPAPPPPGPSAQQGPGQATQSSQPQQQQQQASQMSTPPLRRGTVESNSSPGARPPSPPPSVALSAASSTSSAAGRSQSASQDARERDSPKSVA